MTLLEKLADSYPMLGALLLVVGARAVAAEEGHVHVKTVDESIVESLGNCPLCAGHEPSHLSLIGKLGIIFQN